MKNNLWGTESFDLKPIHVVLFCSRNKDNKHIEGFKERRKSFITHKTPMELEEEFTNFIMDGNPSEMCRMYYSVNARDPQKIYQKLLHFLIDNPNFNLCSMMPKLAGIAAQKECAAEKKWMFDFDIDDEKKADEFVRDIARLVKPQPDDPVTTTKWRTPHGYAIVVDHGFDTRELMKKWDKDVTLKRDDLLCIDWGSVYKRR